MTTTNPVQQIHIARRNPLATALGAVSGFVPAGTYYLGHYQLTSWDPTADAHALLALGGLTFSALTVVAWAADVFAAHDAARLARVAALAKAVAFTVLIEGIMMACSNAWFAFSALGLLIAINAVANGCRLAVRAAASQASDAERAAARAKPKSVRTQAVKPAALRAVP